MLPTVKTLTYHFERSEKSAEGQPYLFINPLSFLLILPTKLIADDAELE